MLSWVRTSTRAFNIAFDFKYTMMFTIISKITTLVSTYLLAFIHKTLLIYNIKLAIESYKLDRTSIYFNRLYYINSR